jgi:hypothetical protein
LRTQTQIFAANEEQKSLTAMWGFSFGGAGLRTIVAHAKMKAH